MVSVTRIASCIRSEELVQSINQSGEGFKPVLWASTEGCYKRWMEWNLQARQTLVIYICVFGLCPGIFYAESNKIVCYVNEALLHLSWGLVASGANQGIPGLELSDLPPDLLGGERGWRLKTVTNGQ